MGNRKKADKKTEATPENTKEALLKAGKELFARVGYDGTTVKDISEKAGVNVSLVSYHFQGKEGLYRAVLEQFGSQRLSVSQRILLPPSSLEEFKVRLQMYISEMLEFLAEQPDLCTIVQREVDSGLPIAKDVFASTFLRVFEQLHSFLNAAKKEKILRSDVDALICASAIQGCLVQTGRHDRIAKEMFGITIQDENHRKKVIDQFLSFFVNGLLKEKV
jgi:AcrR family transcriptional regulator